MTLAYRLLNIHSIYLYLYHTKLRFMISRTGLEGVPATAYEVGGSSLKPYKLEYGYEEEH